MYDLGNNGVRGKLYRTIYFLNSCVFELDELVRRGNVLGVGAVISVNSLETIRDAQNGMTGSRMGNMSLHPLCFVDDIVLSEELVNGCTKEPSSYRSFPG